ncbi:MAG TPA: DJ-1/PfpI family protein [Candidatus Hydrogenedentes bacterium]|nr:DJ-1/PfpI family protein [Candidatus Hydrogenedentota bacterium]HNT87561.1 DJ-1/PfpI family protein [Candidatus Hydrogenedentota bacterium]
MPKVLVPLAQGCEELEAVTIIDLLRRANIQVVAAGLDDVPVKGSHGVVLTPDTTLDDALEQDFDMVVLPGGLPGSDNLGADPRIPAVLAKMVESGKFAGAICAAPRVLAKAGLLDGKKATAYPGFIDGGAFPKVKHTGGAVERDGKIITGRGPGTAMDFALAIIEALTDAKTRNAVEASLVRG